MKKDVFFVGLSNDFKLTPKTIAEICPQIKKEVPCIGHGVNINIISTKDLEIEILAEVTKQIFEMNHDVATFSISQFDITQEYFYTREWIEIVRENTKEVNTLIVFYKHPTKVNGGKFQIYKVDY